jgi:glycosyltransferase involved in cell wall biosynthesis
MTDVEVAIPTCCNDGKTIIYTLKALTEQSYRDFSVLIVYKPTPGDRTAEAVKSFQDRLNIRVIEQEKGKIDEAMNIIFQSSSADVLLTTDDDEIPDVNWVKDHLKFHEKYPEGGAFRGRVKKKTSDLGVRVKDNMVKRFIKNMIYSQYSDQFRDYNGYLTIFGIPNDRRKNAYLPRGGVMKTIALAYENSSFKKQVYRDFRVPGYSLRGFHSEDLICLHAIRKGFFTAEIDGGWAVEIERKEFGSPAESLSTPTSQRGRIGVIVEHFLFPYGAYLEGFKPRRLWLLKSVLALNPDRVRKEASLLGVSLAEESISNQYPPSKVRENLLTALEKFYQKYSM